MPHALSLRLQAGPLLCDGAMGTVLYARGVSLDACFDVLNLNNPRLVQAIHADYIAAGADLIESNTFGANRFKLAVHGLEGQVREVNRRGVRLARDVRESAGPGVSGRWTLCALGVQAIGANCSVGSSTLYEVLEQMVPAAGSLPLSIQPNAGLPSRVGERLIYLSSPTYMAEYAARMVDAGARVVGGCCGTTPQHIAAMREALDRKRPAARETPRPTITVRAPTAGETVGLRRERAPTTFQRKLEAGEFVVTVELDPPRGHTVEKLVQGAKLLKE